MGLAAAEEFFHDVVVAKEKPFPASSNAGTAKLSSRYAGGRRTFIKGVLVGALLSHALWLALFLVIRA